MQQAILDNPEFLSVVREYLEPLNDGSLPSLNVQRTIIEQLSRMDGIDTEILKESGLGKVVNFYTRYPKVEREIARKANQLIDKWSRPIINQRVAPRRNEDELDDDEIDEIEDSAAVKRSKQESLLKRKVEERHRQQEESKGSRLPSVIVSSMFDVARTSILIIFPCLGPRLHDGATTPPQDQVNRGRKSRGAAFA